LNSGDAVIGIACGKKVVLNGSGEIRETVMDEGSRLVFLAEENVMIILLQRLTCPLPDRSISPGNAVPGKDDLPDVVSSRPEGTRAGKKIVLPHPEEAIIETAL
jgi:hypothetical protein